MARVGQNGKSPLIESVISNQEFLNHGQAADGLDVHEPAETAALDPLISAARQAAPEIGIITSWYKHVE